MQVCKCPISNLVPGYREPMQALFGAAAVTASLWLLLLPLKLWYGSSLLSWLRVLCLSLRTCSLRSGAEDAPDVEELQKMTELYNQRRLQRLDFFVDFGSVFLAPVISIIVLQVAYYLMVQEAVSNGPAGLGLGFIGLFIAVVFLLLSSCKRLLNLTSGEAVFTVVYVSPVILMALCHSDWMYSYIGHLMQLTQLFLSQLSTNKRLFVPLNVIVLASQLLIIMTTPALASSAALYVIQPVVSFAYNIALSSSLRSNLLTECAALVGERKAARSEAVIQSLLSQICDAVVSLTPDLCFKEACPQLATMLLSSTGLITQAGQKFSRCIMEPDQGKLEEFLEDQQSNGQNARSIRVRLMDAMGTPVYVQVYHTKMFDLDGKPSHLLGILEDVDTFSRAQTVPFGPNSGAPDAPARRIVNHQPRSDSPGDSEDSDDSVASAGSDARGSQAHAAASRIKAISKWGKRGTAFCKMRTSLKCEVLQESEVSKTLFGLSGLETAEEFFGCFSKPAGVVRWMEFVHVMACCGSVSHERLDYGPVNLLVPCTNVEYEAEMMAEIVQVPAAVADEAPQAGNFGFRSDCQFVDLFLHLDPPKKAKKPKQRRQWVGHSAIAL